MNFKWLFFSEEMTELKIQIETGFETEQDLKKSLQQLEGIYHFRIACGDLYHSMTVFYYLRLSQPRFASDETPGNVISGNKNYISR